MPIYVNMPGGALAHVGQGLKAAQDFQGEEQRRQLQQESFDFEKEVMSKKLDLAQQDLDLEQKQARTQRVDQQAVAEFLTEKYGLSPEERARIEALPERFQALAMQDMGRQKRDAEISAELATLGDQIEDLGDPEMADKVRAGGVSVKTARETARGLKVKVGGLASTTMRRDHFAAKYQELLRVDGFSLPTDTEERDEYDALVEDLVGDTKTDPSVDYEKKYKMLQFLTDPTMRSVVMEQVQRDLGRKLEDLEPYELKRALGKAADADPLDKGAPSRAAVMTQPGARVRRDFATGEAQAAPQAAPGKPQAAPQAQAAAKGGEVDRPEGETLAALEPQEYMAKEREFATGVRDLIAGGPPKGADILNLAQTVFGKAITPEEVRAVLSKVRALLEQFRTPEAAQEEKPKKKPKAKGKTNRGDTGSGATQMGSGSGGSGRLGYPDQMLP